MTSLAVVRTRRAIDLFALALFGIVAGYVLTCVDIVRLHAFGPALERLNAGLTVGWPRLAFALRLVPTSLAAIALAWFASRWREALRSERTGEPLRRAAIVVAPLVASVLTLTQDQIDRRAPFTATLLALSVGIAIWFRAPRIDDDSIAADEPRLRAPRPHAAILLAIALHAAIFCFLSIRRDAAHWSATVDLGIFKEALWNTTRGRILYSPTVGYSFLGEHFSPILLFLVPLYAIAPFSATLLIVQACAISLAAWPIYKLAIANGLGRRLATVVAASMLFAPAMQHAIMYDFHMDLLGVPLLAWVIYAADRRQYRTLAIAAALLCLVKEDMFVAITGIAMAMFFADRKRGARAPIVLALASIVYCGLCIAVFIKQFGPPPGVPEYMADGDRAHGYKFMRNFAHFSGPIGPLRRPIHFVLWVFSDARLTTILVLFAPVLFAPLFAGARIFVLAPLGILLLSDNPDVNEMHYHYGAIQHPGVYAAGIYGMAAWLRHVAPTQLVRARTALAGAVLTASIAMLGLHPLSVFAEANSQDQRHVTPRVRSVDRLMALVPGDAAVTATSFGGPHFSNRFALGMFPEHVGQSLWAFVDLQRPPWPGSPATRDATLLAMMRSGWGAVAWSNGAIVLHRGGNRSRNREAVRDLFVHRRYEVEGTEGTDFPHSIEADANASDGYARIVRPTDRRTGAFVVFGPFIDLPRGRWRITFRLRAGANDFLGDIGAVDAFRDGHVIVQHVLQPDDFPDIGWHDVVLRVNSPGGTGWEFRVRTGRASLLGADAIAIDPDEDVSENQALDWFGF